MSHDLTYLDPLREAGFAAGFVPRVEGVAGSYDKEEGLLSLEPFHRQAVEGLGYDWSQLWRAEQVHGGGIAHVEEGAGRGGTLKGVDGLISNLSTALLGIYVADCGLIWLADQRTRAVALLHSGRKGTEEGILSQAVVAMEERFGSQPQDLLGVLGPCIRPPHYEVDFASMIVEQARVAGVGQFHDCGICTAAEVECYYSYRVEKGLTGRMMGLLGSKPER